MQVFNRIKRDDSFLAVVGLGYVGLPIAVAFAEQVKTIGFDINEDKIQMYRQGTDPTQEVGDERIRCSSLLFTSDAACLRDAGFIVVAVPTPIHGDKTPDLLPIIKASRVVGENLSSGSIVVFESTVYPGVTEEICVPILEEASGLKCGRDFKIGYSPERINPGDHVHRLENICKIVSGMDEDSLEEIAAVYGLIISGGIHKAPTIKVAEAAKLAENTQRDINIAFMNELAMAFERMDISTRDVIAAMNTKWNALDFHPGLVGGHCIGVDPYYFIYKAETLGYNSQIIAAGRRVNDGMSRFVADQTIKMLIRADQQVKKAKIYVMGITFKENCADIRNSKALDICHYLAEYGVSVMVVDPFAAPQMVKEVLGVETVNLEEVKDADALLFLVAHRQFRNLSSDALLRMLAFPQTEKKSVVIDVKGMYSAAWLEQTGCLYWTL